MDEDLKNLLVIQQAYPWIHKKNNRTTPFYEAMDKYGQIITPHQIRLFIQTGVNVREIYKNGNSCLSLTAKLNKAAHDEFTQLCGTCSCCVLRWRD